MKNSHLLLSAITAAALFCCAHAHAKAPDSVTDSFVLTTDIKGCDLDMKQHCRDVTPGANREILCLMAHEDKLQNECRIGLIESGIALDVSVATLDFVHEACGADRLKLCGDVKAGQGRLLNCIKSKEPEVSGDCKTALKQTGLWDAAAIEPSSGE